MLLNYASSSMIRITQTQIDAHLFEVERILSHKGDIKRKRELTFKVKLIGDPLEYKEPWANLRSNEVLRAYLRDKGLRTQIPPAWQACSKSTRDEVLKEGAKINKLPL